MVSWEKNNQKNHADLHSMPFSPPKTGMSTSGGGTKRASKETGDTRPANAGKFSFFYLLHSYSQIQQRILETASATSQCKKKGKILALGEFRIGNWRHSPAISTLFTSAVPHPPEVKIPIFKRQKGI